MFDLEKILAAAEELGFEIEVNSKNPGIHYVFEDETIQSISYDEIRESLEILLDPDLF